MKRIAMRWIPYLALTLIQGCATVDTLLGPPLEARWYFERPLASAPVESSGSRDKTKRPQIEIVLVNRSPLEIHVRKVFLNPYGGHDQWDSSRTWISSDEFVLPPGGYKSLVTNMFSRSVDTGLKSAEYWFSDRCLLPVSLAVEVPTYTRSWLQRLYGRLIGDEDDRIHVDMPDRLPTSIPEEWRKCIPRCESADPPSDQRCVPT